MNTRYIIFVSLLYQYIASVFIFAGFPFQRGRRHMPHVPSLGYSHCEVIRFQPYVFYPDKPIEVQITVNHIDTSDKTYVHDAAVSWVEDINYDRFTACVMSAGFNERKSTANVTVDWIGYQGAPVGGVTGKVRISQWWTGTTCETMNFPSVSDLVDLWLSCALLVKFKKHTTKQQTGSTKNGDYKYPLSSNFSKLQRHIPQRECFL